MSNVISFFANEEIAENNLSKDALKHHNYDLFYSAQSVAEAFSLKKYDVLIIDLSGFSELSRQSEADWIIHYVRVIQKSKIPILALINTLTRAQLNHFLEIGVDDFVYLPIDVSFFTSKITDISSGNVKVSDSLKIRAIDIESVKLKMNFKIKSISESGIELEASSYLARGTKVRISSALIKSIFKKDSINVIAASFSTISDGVYLNLCELDPNSKDESNLLKLWLSENSIGAS